MCVTVDTGPKFAAFIPIHVDAHLLQGERESVCVCARVHLRVCIYICEHVRVCACMYVCVCAWGCGVG